MIPSLRDILRVLRNSHLNKSDSAFSRMGVMPSNNSGIQVGYLCGKYPKRLGWLMSPDGWRKPPSWMPYALDNGAYGAWVNKKEWDEHKFFDLLEKARNSTFPLWVVVPDVVTNRDATIERWHAYYPMVQKILPFTPLAFAVQDGMTPEDVPSNADIVFVGGSFEWKWDTVEMWTKAFPRVHVARVNSERLLWKADLAGAMSVDGTGWLRGGEERLAGLVHYLEVSTPKSGMQILEETGESDSNE